MNYATAYLKSNSVDRATARDMLTSPLGKFLRHYLDTATPLGIKALLDAYDPNVSNTLRGELRTLQAINDLLLSIGTYADGKEAAPVEEDISGELTDPGFEDYKKPIEYR